jgi:tetratricopeptide (TPR) repeat protein
MPTSLPEILSQIKAAYHDGDYARGLALVKTALEIKQADVSTFDSIGSVYYVLGRYGEALSMWGQALPLEHDLRRRRRLEQAIAVARSSLGLPEEPAAARRPSVVAPPQAPPSTEEQAPSTVDPKQVAQLYTQGVKYYAEGQYLQATTMFLRVLELDPGNADATKALERLRMEPGGAPSSQ